MFSFSIISLPSFGFRYLAGKHVVRFFFYYFYHFMPTCCIYDLQSFKNTPILLSHSCFGSLDLFLIHMFTIFTTVPWYNLLLFLISRISSVNHSFFLLIFFLLRSPSQISQESLLRRSLINFRFHPYLFFILSAYISLQLGVDQDRILLYFRRCFRLL